MTLVWRPDYNGTPGKVTLAKPSGASWVITPTYTPNYPTSLTNGQTWLDTNTGITWVYSTDTSSWTIQ